MMKRYQSAMEHCAPPEGLEQRLRQKVLAAQPPENRQVFRPRGFFRKAALAAVLVVTAAVVFLLRGSGLPAENVSTPDYVEKDYLTVNPWSRPGEPLEEINGVVIHYVGNPGTTAGQNRSYFAGLARSGETYASSHFLIGLDGEILQCVPLDEVAYCSNQRNHDTLSIECCHPDDSGRFTQATYDALVRLVRWLREYYGLEAGQIIRHYDVTGKECPRYYVQHPEAWAQFLLDVQE